MALGARMHAFVHGLFRPSDEELTRTLFDKVTGLFRQHELDSEDGRVRFVLQVVHEVLDRCDIDLEDDDRLTFATLVLRLLDYEDMFVLPKVDWTEQRSVSGYWEIRDHLNRQRPGSRISIRFAST